MVREGIQMSFLGWMKHAVPFSLVLLIVLWLYLTWRSKLPKNVVVEVEKIGLGPEAKLVGLIITITVLLWVLRPLILERTGLRINDAMIGIFGSSLLFLVRSKKKPLLKFKEVRIPWGIIFMLGGGLAIGNILLASGASDLFVHGLNFLPRNELIFLVVIATIANLSTELISNTALSATFMPVVVLLYNSVGFDPFIGILTVAVCSDMAFMLPIATPPNAIVSKSKYVNFKEMIKHGFLLNVIVIVLWVLYAWFIL